MRVRKQLILTRGVQHILISIAPLLYLILLLRHGIYPRTRGYSKRVIFDIHLRAAMPPQSSIYLITC